MKKIAFVGCGGINSWAAQHLFDVSKMFERDEVIYVKIFDEDIIEEKNLKRRNQNFDFDELMEPKAETIGKRYNFDYENIFITKDNISKLDRFDDIILGVDNHKTRKLIYEYALKNDKFLLDMRAQGTLFSYYVVDGSKDMEYYNKKFFSNENIMERKGSCQLQNDIENNHIENGNKVIAYFGIYGIFFKRIREEKIAAKEFKFAY